MDWRKIGESCGLSAATLDPLVNDLAAQKLVYIADGNMCRMAMLSRHLIDDVAEIERERRWKRFEIALFVVVVLSMLLLLTLTDRGGIG